MSVIKDIFVIKLDINEIGNFVSAASSMQNDVQLYQGSTVVSGKSLMGLYSLDLSREIKMIVNDRENDEIVLNTFSKWIIK